MANEDFKKILKAALKPMREDIASVKKDLVVVKGEITTIKKDLVVVKGEITTIKKTQEDHTNRLDAIAGDTEQLLDDVKGIRDEIGLWHQRDKREIDEIKNHVGLPLIPDVP